MAIYKPSKGVKQKNGKVWDPTLKSKNSATYARANEVETKEPELARAHREEWRKEGKDGLHS
ncbi:hypothetical protein CRP7_gp60 [Roseobacter phage CRP-7]|jgi:hypothetical protein|nr:hypothetical protein [bacterium]QBQ72853.1 hypothetical protein CRP7_gp60 [Roseobacter phage CRP-7]